MTLRYPFNQEQTKNNSANQKRDPPHQVNDHNEPLDSYLYSSKVTTTEPTWQLYSFILLVSQVLSKGFFTLEWSDLSILHILTWTSSIHNIGKVYPMAHHVSLHVGHVILRMSQQSWHINRPNYNNWSFQGEVLLKSASLLSRYWREVALPHHDDNFILTGLSVSFDSYIF